MIPAKRLLFYCHGFVGGGAERLWALLASGFKHRGYDVDIAVDFISNENVSFVDKSIPIHVLGNDHIGATRRLAKLIADIQPHAALSALGASNVKLILAGYVSRQTTKIIQSYHGRFETETRPLGRLSYLMTALTSRLAWRTIAVSHDLRAYLLEKFAADHVRTIAIPNAVLVPARPNLLTSAALAARPQCLLAIGRLVPEKGMHHVIEALAGLPQTVRLIILGEGPERPRLEELIARLSLSERVDMRGYVADPWPVFKEVKMLVLASSTEAFGNVLVEGLGQGLPVVATACGGPAEILENGRFGRLVPVGDVAALRQAIATTLAEPGDPLAHHQRAKDFDLETALTRYEALFSA